jgi:hypothetical protein
LCQPDPDAVGVAERLGVAEGLVLRQRKPDRHRGRQRPGHPLSIPDPLAKRERVA